MKTALSEEDEDESADNNNNAVANGDDSDRCEVQESAKSGRKGEEVAKGRAAAREERVAELVSTLTTKFEHLFRARLITPVFHNRTKFPLQKSNAHPSDWPSSTLTRSRPSFSMDDVLGRFPYRHHVPLGDPSTLPSHRRPLWIRFPWLLQHIFPFCSGADHHDFHHMAFTNNYSTSFRWWDHLFGTNDKYRAYKAKLKAAKSQGKDVRKLEQELLEQTEKEGAIAEKVAEQKQI
ncbi:C-4 sterol methyl oxidase [Serendipita sp. 411]|nr:C-4 sterol methyl oxidase [Serendipita sp. 411]